MLANQNGASLQDAVSKINGLLSEPSTPTEPEQTEPEAKQEPINESAEPETQAVEKTKSDTEAPSRRRKAKLGDREIEFEVLSDDIDPDLVPKGLMMENDYRQKTMSLSEERKAFESQKQEFDAKLAELNDLVMAKADDLESDEMKELKELDPTEYWKKFEEVKTQAEKVAKYKEQRDSELMEQYQELIQQEQARYTEVIPEWLDDNAKAEDVQKMGSYLKGLGFSDQEINGVYDARHIATIRKAALYDEITSKAKDFSSKRVKEAPKSAKPSSTTESQEKTAKQKSMDRLRKTGKLNDASAAIKDILFS